MRFIACRYCGNQNIVVGTGHLCDEMKEKNVPSQRASYENKDHFATLEEIWNSENSSSWTIKPEETGGN